MAVTTATREYNIIYVYSVPYDDHRGLLKIGKAEVDVEEDYYPTPNDEPMTKAAEKRIAEQLGTGGFKHTLEYTEVAHYRDENGKGKAFDDHAVHDVLKHSGYSNHDFGEDISGGEWFPVSLEIAKLAIQAVKEERQSLTSPKHSIPDEEIHFREE
ncbi:MAG: GIY-YIG nuclease family protein, partial [Paludibacteraceae bacterium]|nr:GIY-YIG nuclease family protein [Paludibacteraceae bacterium]